MKERETNSLKLHKLDENCDHQLAQTQVTLCKSCLTCWHQSIAKKSYQKGLGSDTTKEIFTVQVAQVSNATKMGKEFSTASCWYFFFDSGRPSWALRACVEFTVTACTSSIEARRAMHLFPWMISACIVQDLTTVHEPGSTRQHSEQLTQSWSWSSAS